MEVLEFLDDSGKVIVKRIPDSGKLEIKWGAQLTVRESQEAVFFRDGRALDVFGAGRHILQTQNIPVVAKWVTSFGYGPTSPFRAEVIFIGKQLFPNLKWGTKEPILFRDNELHAIRLRAFGGFSIRVNDALLFVNKVVGTMGLYTTSVIEDYLKVIIVSKLNVVLGKIHNSVFDIAKNIDQLNLIMRAELEADFSGLGLQLHDIYVQSISVPPEVQKMIDERSGMGAVGNLDSYMKFKLANALDDSANNPNSGSDGLSTGAGLAMGLNMANAINKSMNNEPVKEDISDKLKKLKELLDLGAITSDEFDKKKKEILDRF